MIFWIIIAALVLLVVGVFAIYNGLITARNRVKESWSGIDVQLKRRADLIPNLVETVKGYANTKKKCLRMSPKQEVRCSLQAVQKKLEKRITCFPAHSRLYLRSLKLTLN